MLADFLNTENGIVVNLHVQAIDQSEAIKTVKRKITDLDAMKIQEQKRAVRSGYDMDILPSEDVYKRQFLSFPDPLLWRTRRHSRRNGKERKRNHRAP